MTERLIILETNPPHNYTKEVFGKPVIGEAMLSVTLRAGVVAAILLPATVAAQVQIEINNTTTLRDDFVCWNPIPARIRWEPADGAAVEVTLSSVSAGPGAVRFAADPGVAVTADTYTPVDALTLQLPGDGSWMPFLVSGKTASQLASAAVEKDITIQATNTVDGTVVGELGTMVRVRKDALALTPVERDLFLSSLAALHGLDRPIGPGREYIKYSEAHDEAFPFGIHRGGEGFPLFLAWHRAFLLSLERELQAIDPRVTIPYWRFDRASSALFSPDFIGVVAGGENVGGFEVTFSETNPIDGWFTRADGVLRRVNDGDPDLTTVPWGANFHAFQLPILFQANADSNFEYRGPVATRGMNGLLEGFYHNGAHDFVNGWLGSAASPRDPLFFLLHANVDHGWAMWQAERDRWDSADLAAYPEAGQYPGDDPSGPWRKSSYAADIMWPWSLDDGISTPGDPEDDWPTRGFAFPASPDNHGPLPGPTPATMIDYMNVLGRSAPLGMCYDDLAFAK